MVQSDNGQSADASYDDSDLRKTSLTKREDHVRRNFWSKFKRFASKLPFAEDLVAAYYCSMDPQTPNQVRGILLGALAYFILPLDLIPDFIVGFGFGDDAAVLAMVISMVSQHIKPKHRLAAQQALERDNPDASKP